MSNYCENFIVDGKCSHCGADVEDTDKYCHECGKRIHPAHRMGEKKTRRQRNFDIYRRWLDGVTLKVIAQEFGMSESNVATTVRFTVGKMQFSDLPDDIRERVVGMVGAVGELDRMRMYYEMLKVIRKL